MLDAAELDLGLPEYETPTHLTLTGYPPVGGPLGRPLGAKDREPRKPVNSRQRKASKSKGDDHTLSRFVKIDAGPIKPTPRQDRMQGFEHWAVEAGVSYYTRKGVHEPRDEKPKAAHSYRVLVSGHSNAKLGRDVRQGKLKGYWIYALTLEERATCPRSCQHWSNCYGNGMPYAHRNSHKDPERLQAAIEADIRDILAIRGRKGLLVRLHALGDFFSEEYVEFWGRMVEKYDRLVVFGYTAWQPGTQIGDAVARVKNRLGFDRFAIRYSDGGGERDCTISIYDLTAPTNSFICPEQSRGVTSQGKPILCATCGLCWSTRKNVAFVNHGR